ncbi:MAG: RNA-binding transcriptional accessory protein [Firmicutes bacterium]|nr:RNA-binding transcriptional accessory protein [Bacillota bacterium]
MNINEKLSQEFGIRLNFVDQTVALIDEGNTIPFIARYRKEVTGGLTDIVLRDLEERLTYLRGLETRKAEVLKSIEEQGKLTEELKADIMSAEILQRVEDLYKPFKQKKATRASKAREKGLAPLAEIIWAQAETEGDLVAKASAYIDEEKGVKTAADALAGACDIIAERISDDPELTELIRNKTREEGSIVSEAADPEEKTVYDMYYEYAEAVSKIPNHRVLAVNRGEKEKKLKVKVKADVERMHAAIADRVITNSGSIYAEKLAETIADAYKRLMAPSVERELRNELTERAEKEAVKVFAKNTENLLMVPPVKNARVLSIDPGYRTGCKVAALSNTGKLLAYATIYPTEPKNDIAGSEKIITKLIDKFKLNTVVIGNGTGSRETEKFIADYIAKTGRDLKYTIVSEAGASVYSASKLASEEYPDLDVTTRGAMSIGRRLQDPLAELVKISPKHIGVGQYQHDINQGLLDTALTNVVEDCVNRVGVDLNTASPSLLAYISGINSSIAKNIVAYREANGVFTDRKQLMKVPKLGEKTYKQCAGFMRISEGDNPLDATAVHPESYAVTDAMLSKLGISKDQIAAGGAGDIEERICQVYPIESKRKPEKKKAVPANGFAALAVLLEDDEFTGKNKKGQKQKKTQNLKLSIQKMADDMGIGVMTLSDIVEEIKKPARDPREGMPPVVFRQDVLSFDDLKPDMELTGTVRNVVDFGAFVDIGVKTDGLVHVSQLSSKFIKHPMDAVSVGDTVKVKVLEVDRERHKISLTMKF